MPWLVCHPLWQLHHSVHCFCCHISFCLWPSCLTFTYKDIGPTCIIQKNLPVSNSSFNLICKIHLPCKVTKWQVPGFRHLCRRAIVLPTSQDKNGSEIAQEVDRGDGLHLGGPFFNIYLSLSCSMRNLVPWPGIEPRPPALGAWNLKSPSGKSLEGVSLVHTFRMRLAWRSLCPCR